MRALLEILSEHGFTRARQILSERLDAARLDMRLNYAGIPDGADPRRVAPARQATYDADYSRHALYVLAGKYDAAVRAGRPTLTVDGEQPPIVAAAHAWRAAAL